MLRTRSLILLSLLSALLQADAKEQLMSLQIKAGSLRTTPTFFGAVTTTVSYGDRLSVIETKGDWSKVTPIDSEKSGWIHNSALTKRKLELKSTESTDVAASSGELALAGKGFNSKVEAEFKANNKDIDFTWIDKMEKIVVPYTKMKQFLEQGQVTPNGGGK